MVVSVIIRHIIRITAGRACALAVSKYGEKYAEGLEQSMTPEEVIEKLPPDISLNLNKHAQKVVGGYFFIGIGILFLLFAISIGSDMGGICGALPILFGLGIFLLGLFMLLLGKEGLEQVEKVISEYYSKLLNKGDIGKAKESLIEDTSPESINNEKEKRSVCFKCGESLDIDAIFCPGCGNKTVNGDEDHDQM